MMARIYLLVVLCALVGLAELSLASKDCDLECVLARLADLEQKERKHEADKTELRGIIASQQSTLEHQARRIHKLEKTVTELKHENKEAKVSHASNTQATRVHSKVNSLQPRPRHRHPGSVIKPRAKRQEHAGIAFSAYLDHDLNLPGFHTTIKFNQIILNEGNAYNVHTGVFTCPEAGVYLLTFSIGERGNRESRVFMIKNSQNLVDANADSLHTTQELQGGNTAIVRLSAGDAVWLESAQNGGYVEGETGLRLTTFSGAYLYP